MFRWPLGSLQPFQRPRVPSQACHQSTSAQGSLSLWFQMEHILLECTLFRIFKVHCHHWFYKIAYLKGLWLKN